MAEWPGEHAVVDLSPEPAWESGRPKVETYSRHRNRWGDDVYVAAQLD
jgi:hypothetical protein